MYLTTDQERTLIPCGEAVPKFKHSEFWKVLFFCHVCYWDCTAVSCKCSVNKWCLLLRMNQRRSDSFWMVKARGTASVWLVNLSLYQTADQMVVLLGLLSRHCCSNLSAQIRCCMLPIKCMVFNGFYFSVTIVATTTTISLFILQTHTSPGKGRTNTRRQHMKPYTLSSNGSHHS